MDSIYKKLIQIPVFQGMTEMGFKEIMDSTRFHFLKFSTGETIIREGDEHTDIRFLISGSITSEISNFSKNIKLTETIPAPAVIAPNFLFGKVTKSPVTITADEEAGIMQLDKQVFMELMQRDRIIMLNFLNSISFRSQNYSDAFSNTYSCNFKARFTYWLLYFTKPKAYNIRVYAKTKDLYAFFGVQRYIFISMLDELRDMGIIEYDQRLVVIPNRERLLEYYNSVV